MKVKVETRTSSSAQTPAMSSATWSAAVPLTVATACPVPVRSASMRSKRSTNGPTDETQLVSKHSLTYFHSLPLMCGTLKGMTPAATAPGSVGSCGADDEGPVDSGSVDEDFVDDISIDGSDSIDARPVSLIVLLHPFDGAL